jgi:hypothetical protein
MIWRAPRRAGGADCSGGRADTRAGRRGAQQQFDGLCPLLTCASVGVALWHLYATMAPRIQLLIIIFNLSSSWLFVLRTRARVAAQPAHGRERELGRQVVGAQLRLA